MKKEILIVIAKMNLLKDLTNEILTYVDTSQISLELISIKEQES